MEKNNGNYIFHRVERHPKTEIAQLEELQKRGLVLKNSKVALPESTAFDWLSTHRSSLLKKGYVYKLISPLLNNLFPS